MRIEVPRRLRNTNRHPEKGSAWSLSWHSLASESMPFRPSTGSIATRMRICGVIWITPTPTMPGSVRRDPAPGPFPLDAHLATRPFHLDDALGETDSQWLHQLQKLRRRRGRAHDGPDWRGRFHHALQLAILQA